MPTGGKRTVRHSGYGGLVVKFVKIALVVLLVVVVVFTGVPVVMGGSSMDACADCESAVLAYGLCLSAMLVAFTFLVGLTSSRYRFALREHRGLRLAVVLERPPRLV